MLGLENVFCIVEKSFKILTLSVSQYCMGLLRRCRGPEHYGSVAKKEPEKQVLYLKKAAQARKLPNFEDRFLFCPRVK